MSEAGARDAADPLRSAWVAANAGAGKTHALASRVTRLLPGGARPERVLCLTYTKAAAAEMSSRLFRQLGEWAMLPDAKLQEKIADVGGLEQDARELRKARRLFALALEPPAASKSDHSFLLPESCHASPEADVTPAFRVDEQTTRELLSERASAGTGWRQPRNQQAIDHLVTYTSEGRMQQVLDAALGSDRHKLDRFLAQLVRPAAPIGARRSWT